MNGADQRLSASLIHYPIGLAFHDVFTSSIHHGVPRPSGKEIAELSLHGGHEQAHDYTIRMET